MILRKVVRVLSIDLFSKSYFLGVKVKPADVMKKIT